MERKDRVDMAGAAALAGFAAILAFNQVVIKVSNGGISPVFGAGLRSVLALMVLIAWCALARRPLGDIRAAWRSGLLLGGLFTLEFFLLFLALDLTTVSRTSILFYSMPVWLALVAHVRLPGERLTPVRAFGLVLAMAGVIWALSDPQSRSQGAILGDLLAFGAALCWAGIALTARLTRVAHLPPEGQLMWQLVMSGAILCAVAPLFGPLIRDIAPVHLWGMGYQVICVASFGFLAWFWLLRTYPASDVAAFSFLSPVLAVGMGWLLLNEPVGPGFLGALCLVAVGIVLINRR